MNPMLASDWDQSKVRFPLLGQPKIDGVRALNLHGALQARSLKLHANRFTTNFYSHPHFVGFDGEMAAAHERDPDLCRKTTSALSTIEGSPFTLWWLFDYLAPEARQLPYYTRYLMLEARVSELQRFPGQYLNASHLRVVPQRRIETLEELLAYDDENLDLGYEGTILRDPNGLHKAGRSTVREGGLLRIKRFLDGEAMITGVTEGEENGNVAQTNELGLQFRSTHKANMIPNGMIGNITAVALADIMDGKRKVIEKGQTLTISPGNMPHDQRRYFFQHQHLFVGKVCKFKFFPKGIKDKPRFPTFVSLRSQEDM